MPAPRLKILRIDPAQARDAASWSSALAALTPSRILKQEHGSTVCLARMLGRDVVVKIRDLGLADRLKLALGAGRARRHWINARWLIRHGFHTALPLVIATQGAPHHREWLVMEALPGKSLLEHIADDDLSPRDQHALARAIGRLVSDLSRAGRFNRDHKPSNLIITRHDKGFSIAIIDCVAIQPGGKGRQRMLHALAVEPLGLRILPRRSLLARVVAAMVDADSAGKDAALPDSRAARRTARRTWHRDVLASLRRCADPTPRTNPLTPP